MSVKIDENSASIGLIGTFDGSLSSYVQNILLEGISISGKPSKQIIVGALIGNIVRGTVENCHVAGKMEIEIDEYFYCGGLIGYSANSGNKVTKCSSDVDIEITKPENNGSDCYVGGLIGYPAGGIQIYNCESKGDIAFNLTLTEDNIAENDYIGGLVGYTKVSLPIINCMTSGNISLTWDSKKGSDYEYKKQQTWIGGFIGGVRNGDNNNDMNISVDNCVSKATITKSISPDGANTENIHIGSFVGCLYKQSKNISLTADNCYYIAIEGIDAVGYNNSDSEATYGELFAISTDMDLVSAMNDWIAEYEGEEELLSWNENGLVIPVMPVEGTDYVWSEDNKTCTIKTITGLLWLSEQVYKGADFEEQTIKLDEGDWDLSDYEWLPIGCENPKAPFKGTFDGNFQEVT